MGPDRPAGHEGRGDRADRVRQGAHLPAVDAEQRLLQPGLPGRQLRRHGPDRLTGQTGSAASRESRWGCRRPAGAIPGWAPAHTVVIFIIQRLIGTILLLIAVSMITFAIFFLIPRLAGQNIYQLAPQYVGRNPPGRRSSRSSSSCAR